MPSSVTGRFSVHQTILVFGTEISGVWIMVISIESVAPLQGGEPVAESMSVTTPLDISLGPGVYVALRFDGTSNTPSPLVVQSRDVVFSSVASDKV